MITILRDGDRQTEFGKKKHPECDVDKAMICRLMLSLRFKNGANMNRYQLLADTLRQKINDHTWRAGEKFPSLRVASKSYSVSPATVLQAYQLLEAEGLISARPQSGYFVTSRVEHLEPQPNSTLVPDPYQDQLYQFLKSNNQASVALGSPFPAPKLFPHSLLNRHLASAGRKLNDNHLLDNLPPGCESLRRLIAQRYLNQGIAVSHQDIVLTSGAMEALNLSLQAVCQPGDTVVIETPAFYGVLQAVERLKLNAIQVPVDPVYGLNTALLEQAFSEHDVKACWLMVNYHNPTGATLSDGAKQRVVELANQYDVTIIEDDVYGELHYSSSRPYPLKYWDQQERVLLCGSLSKSLCPGYRIGWVVNRTHNERLQKQQLISTLSGSAPIQQGIAHYLQYDSYDSHLRKLRKQLEKRQQECVSLIRQHCPIETKIHQPQGGYFVWLEFAPHVDSYRIYCELKQSGISIAYGNLFCVGSQFQNCMRINTSLHTSDDLVAAIERIGQLALLQS